MMPMYCALYSSEETRLEQVSTVTLGMCDNKNFMSRYIIRVIITIIDIITISLNSTTGTKIVKMSRKYFTDRNDSEQ